MTKTLKQRIKKIDKILDRCHKTPRRGMFKQGDLIEMTRGEYIYVSEQPQDEYDFSHEYFLTGARFLLLADEAQNKGCIRVLDVTGNRKISLFIKPDKSDPDNSWAFPVKFPYRLRSRIS